MSGKAAAVKAVATPPPLPPAHDVEHQDECIVCAEPLNQDTHLHTVSVCGHPETICSMCFFRIRSLQHNFSCPTCKRQLDHVICVTDKIVKYGDFNIWGDNIDGYHFDEPSKMFFPTEYFQQNIAKLRQYSCRLCHQTRRDFKQLKGHYFGEHQRHLCQLCHDHKQIFPAELVCYDQAAYERHIRHGDGDGSVGHPNCEFCRTRFYDSHALFIHLSREHYTCHICEQMGQKFKYFHSYQHLETHFRKDHIICEDPACLERRFVVFGNEFDFAAHTRQYHPHLASGRGVQIRFNYKAGTAGNSTASTAIADERTATTTQDNPEYVSRNARFEGGMGGRAQNGEWQVEIQAMSRDPRDPNRHSRTDTSVITSTATNNAPQEEFPTLAATMGAATLGPQKWAQARSDGVNQMQKRSNDFPALPSSTSAKGSSFNKNSLVKGSIPLSRSTGSLASSTGSSKKAAAVVGSGGNSSKANRPVTSAAAVVNDDDDWNSSGYTNNYAYECDLSAAIAASLTDVPTSRPLASTSRTSSATQLNRASPQTLEEAFPVLGGGGSGAGSGNATPSVPATAAKGDSKKKPATNNNNNRGKLSNDLMDAMKMIGSDPSKKKKKASSGLTVVKTLKPRVNEDNDNVANTSGNTSPVPPPPASTTSRVNPPPVPAPGTGGIGKGPSWGKTYGGFGGSAPSSGGGSQTDFPSLR